MTDYATLLDAEVLAFIDKTNSYYPPETIDHTIGQQRDVYNRMCRAFFNGYPDGVTAADSSISAIPQPIAIRTYRSASTDPSARVLYLHGGGFILGGLDSHDDICADICAQTGYEVTSVDYRLAPEHPHPAAFDDAHAAFEWAAARDTTPIVLVGDSAGANLAAGVAHFSRRHAQPPAGQVLIYPGLGGDPTKGSYAEHAEAPMLTLRDLIFYKDVRTGGADFSHDVRYLPLADTDFAGLPPTVIISAQCDPLSSDGETYRDRIAAAGGKAFWHEEPGLVHGYLRGRHSIGKARDSFARIVGAVKALGQREWPY
ncbi:MAG: alpha/beta hydrolase [Rhizobiaceae bacterium]